MEYSYIINVRDHQELRASFNELTQKTFGFNFINWYEKGHWGDKYIPHVLTDNGKVISNVSVNRMTFRISGEIKNYIQLGTIMTDPDYRGQGLNKYIMDRIFEEYQGTVDGIYLFGNDSVLDYYPKFGFKPINEYEYSRKLHQKGKKITDMQVNGYQLEKVDMSDRNKSEKLYHTIDEYHSAAGGDNPNDGFNMCDNLGLYQFWLAEVYQDSVYYLPEMEAYVIADLESDTLVIHQMISRNEIDINRFAASFKEEIAEIKLGFTPIKKDDYKMKLHKEEDCTLFIIGESLEQLEKEKMIFPVISHA